MTIQRCGTIALVGRPNVGKSTLLNALLAKKISITAPKPQTTRHQILGVKTTKHCQIIIVDTPGLHKNAKRRLNKRMNQTANAAAHDVDLIVMVVDGLYWTQEDQWVLEQIKTHDHPVMLCINKTDRLKDIDELFPHVTALMEKHDFCDIVSTSALRERHLNTLIDKITTHLPAGEFLYPKDTTTDRDRLFTSSELIREQLIRQLHHELPYACRVGIESCEKDDKGIQHLSAVIWVETPGQKGIVIGKQGQQLKHIGKFAREHLEALWETKVMLRLWVKVKPDWPDDEHTLNQEAFIR